MQNTHDPALRSQAVRAEKSGRWKKINVARINPNKKLSVDEALATANDALLRHAALWEARKKDPRIAAMIERDEHQQAALQARFKWREEEENRLRLDPSAQPRTVPVFFAMSLEELRQIIPEPEPAPAMTPEQAMDPWYGRPLEEKAAALFEWHSVSSLESMGLPVTQAMRDAEKVPPAPVVIQGNEEYQNLPWAKASRAKQNGEPTKPDTSSVPRKTPKQATDAPREPESEERTAAVISQPADSNGGDAQPASADENGFTVEEICAPPMPSISISTVPASSTEPRPESLPDLPFPKLAKWVTAKGHRSGRTWGLLAGSGVGKTTLVLQFAEHYAFHGHYVLFVHMEMDTEDNQEKLATLAAFNDWSTEHHSRIIFLNGADLSWPELQRQIADHVSLYRPSVFMLDNVQLLHDSYEFAGERFTSLGRLTHALVKQAKHDEMFSWLLLQQNSPEQRHRNELRGLESIEGGQSRIKANLDGVLAIDPVEEPVGAGDKEETFRHLIKMDLFEALNPGEADAPERTEPQEVIVSVLKNRYGTRGRFAAFYDAPNCRFYVVQDKKSLSAIVAGFEPEQSESQRKKKGPTSPHPDVPKEWKDTYRDRKRGFLNPKPDREPIFFQWVTLDSVDTSQEDQARFYAYLRTLPGYGEPEDSDEPDAKDHPRISLHRLDNDPAIGYREGNLKWVSRRQQTAAGMRRPPRSRSRAESRRERLKNDGIEV